MLTISQENLNFLLALSLALVDDLDGVLHPGGLVYTSLAHAVASLSNLFTQLILLQEVPCLSKAEGGIDSVRFGTLDPYSKSSIVSACIVLCISILVQ